MTPLFSVLVAPLVLPKHRPLAAAQRTALLCAGLALLFALRVLGQALVAFFAVGFLPPMHLWYSGLIPYPVLLPLQLAILALQHRMVHDLWRGSGHFSLRRPRAGAWLQRIAWLYAAVMALRYALSMILVPEMRWAGGAIPVCFHLVLAGYLRVYARHLQQTGEESS